MLKVSVSARVQIFTKYLSVWYFLYQLISLQPNNKCVDVLLLIARPTANKVGICFILSHTVTYSITIGTHTVCVCVGGGGDERGGASEHSPMFGSTLKHHSYQTLTILLS